MFLATPKAEAEDFLDLKSFKANLSNIARSCLKKKKKRRG
jgi:hypothetical protein